MVNAPSNIDWDLFRKLVVCSKYKSFSQAADEAGIQKSALVLHLKRLEKEMGTTLFNRRGEAIINSLTPQGMDLLNKVKKIEAFLNNDKDDVFVEQSNELHIYTTEGIAYTLLPKIIEEFYHTDPSVKILVLKQQYSRQIGNGEIIIRGHFVNQSNLEKIKISSMQLGFFASQAYIDINGNPRSFQEADNHKFVYTYGSRVENFFRANSRIIEPSIISSSVEFIFEMAAGGIGISEFPLTYPRVEKLVRVLEDEPINHQDIYALYIKNQYMSPPMQKFISFLSGFALSKD